MEVNTRQSFEDALCTSGLLDQASLDEVSHWLDAHATPARLADELVSRGKLSQWQSEQILAGRTSFYLGKYKLLDQLGKGGMGVVYKALQTMTGRVVALKVMSRKLMANPVAAARFQREVKLIASLNHPNIITAYDADFVDDTYFLVMEFGEGRDLKAWLDEYGQLSIDWACDCIRQAALGLQHAHERGMVHRDIKPHNLLVDIEPATGQPVVKILDLGLARLADDAAVPDAELTGTDQILGTPDYIAPEQAEHMHTADIRADIFSLGCTLFELLTGRLPYTGADPMETLMARVIEDAPTLREVRGDLPASLERVVARMLARDPAERYQTPGEVADALAPFASAEQQTMTLEGPLDSTIASPKAGPAIELTDKDFSFTPPSLRTGSTVVGGQTAVVSAAPAPDVQIAPRTPSASTRRPRSRPAPSAIPRQWLKGMVVGLAMGAPLVALGAWWISRDAVVVLDWNENQRRGARVDVDGRQVAFERQGAVEIRMEAGPHRVLLRRRGYEPIEWNLNVRAGQRLKRKVSWRKVNLKAPMGEL